MITTEPLEIFRTDGKKIVMGQRYDTQHCKKVTELRYFRPIFSMAVFLFFFLLLLLLFLLFYFSTVTYAMTSFGLLQTDNHHDSHLVALRNVS